ncbi:glycosyltransferase [Sporichthya sp.]|uniref:glycosyltransferase family protein n=1 Tax=Sporichthya sp. TaxID=65475 RepID=UPI00183ED528|nr:glycosyltransferase [Sporichthya sp.]MBA3744308.1 glycosyltransferase [Sporichthya sp.]
MARSVGRLLRRERPAEPAGDRAPACVVLVMHKEARATVRTLNRLADTRDPEQPVGILVVANGSPPATIAEVNALWARLPELELLTLPARLDSRGALARALEQATAEVVVALSPGVEPQPGWLPPLLRTLDDPAVLGTAPVLRALDGTLVSAGSAFPPGDAPQPFLAGFPPADAAFLAEHPLSAVHGPAVAFRTADLAALGGPRPETGDALGWADFSLLLAATRSGHFRTSLQSSVVVRNPASPSPQERARFTAHWPEGPGDDVELWRRAGFAVTGHDADGTPELRRLPVAVRQGVPCLRWAVKNPATALSRGEQWGDTHFCRRLAEALRRLGQAVAIDHREAFDRPTGQFDDVTLVVRGLSPHTPTPGAINLAWLISHPELLTANEAAAYDRVFAAGPAWAEQRSREWHLRIDPLLQATDAALFHPDRAAPDSGHPVLFVGSAREGGRDIVRQATEAGLTVTAYGTGWDGHLPASQIAGDYLDNDALGVAYRGAGIVLNDHWAAMRTGGFVSNRLFDAAAAGARVITDDVTGLDALAGVFGRSVQVARGPEDIQRLAADLAAFGDDAERRAVAARVHAGHSFDARARVLLDAALELRAR